MWDSPSQRPEHFSLNPYSSLNEGLMFAGLGGGATTNLYADSSGHGFDGSLTNMNAPTDWVWEPELNRFALDFDGTNDYIQGSGAGVSGINISIALWARFDKVNTIAALFANRANNTNGSLLFLLSSKITWDNTTSASRWATNYVPSLATWTHLVLTGDAAGRKLYVNGVLNDTGSAGTAITGYVDFRIGSDTSAVQYPIGASFSDFCLYKRALAPSEIQQLADPSNVMLSGLVLPPRRRIFKATAAFKPYWAIRQHQTIGGGTI